VAVVNPAGLSLGAWQPLTLAPNITATATFHAPRAALLGPAMLLLSGSFSTGIAIAPTVTVFTLPLASMFPPVLLAFTTADPASGDGIRLTIDAAGICRNGSSVSMATASTFALDGLLLDLGA
jgi:hypothetical protein